jgi:diguanylate cyclase (GGDEF)-like protein
MQGQQAERNAAFEEAAFENIATDAHREEAVKRWRMKQTSQFLYDNSQTALFGSVANMAIVAVVLMDVFPVPGLLLWLLAGLLVAVSRMMLYHRFMQDSGRHNALAWINRYRITTLLSGCLYGFLGVYYFSDDPLYQALVIFLVGGITSAAVGTYASDLTTYRLLLLPALLPLIARVFAEGGRTHISLAIMLVFLLLVLMRTARQTNRIILENIDMAHTLQYRATHDSLVGLLNREEFENVYVDRTAGGAVAHALIFIDLDNFKALNDTLGHQAGDQALRKVGEIIRSSVRKNDVAGRLGGDEFVVLLIPCSFEDSQTVAGHILASLNASQLHLPDGTPRISASQGIAYTAEGSVTFAAMMKAADHACYEAKRAGKGRTSTTRI